MTQFNIISVSGVASQSRTSGCLVTSGCCWPSAADEELYSPKGLPAQLQSNTVVEAQYRGESPIFLTIIIPFPLDGISLSLSSLCPSGTVRNAASVAPFMETDSSLLSHYGGHVLHLGAENSQGVVKLSLLLYLS